MSTNRMQVNAKPSRQTEVPLLLRLGPGVLMLIWALAAIGVCCLIYGMPHPGAWIAAELAKRLGA